MATSDTLAFRRLLGQFATGVTVATTLADDGRPAGMTASAVASVSLDPPLLLVCVNHGADFHAALRGARGFALNVLAGDQEALSRRFASEEIDKFAGLDYDRGPDGVPLLAGVAAHIFCARWGEYDVADHTIFFGRVTGGAVFDRAPLLHYRSGYTTTHSDP